MAKSWAARLCRFARQRTFVAQELIKTYKNNQTKVLRNLRRNEKMEKEEKKFYESPTMTVCEISMTQILAGSDPDATPATSATTTEDYYENDFNWE